MRKKGFTEKIHSQSYSQFGPNPESIAIVLSRKQKIRISCVDASVLALCNTQSQRVA